MGIFKIELESNSRLPIPPFYGRVYCNEIKHCFVQIEKSNRVFINIRWGHVAPTCPDTLGCYPTYLEDPFVLQTLPDILIASNQVQFKSS